ncbi:MAG: Eco57I restriction-modification methylase domain-containing protein [Sulfobacillus sp.]
MTAEVFTPSQPDILEVIANLSNDEVFTPPKVTKAVLSLLPPEVWSDPTLRWLDPGCKTGTFAREITKRLMIGLVDAIPDETQRLNHILTDMVFAIAITELTGMMSRRTLYCSKDASSEFSAVRFAKPSGNIWHDRVEHSFDDKGRCPECGGTRAQLETVGRDNYAYGFIHFEGRSKIEKEMDMKFDVIVGNPPYQMDDEGGHRPVPIYNKFVEQALALDPAYIAMVTPSRWMAGGLGLADYRAKMLADPRIRVLVDYPVASELFPGVEIKGGVSYFLWDRDNPGQCRMTTIRGDEIYGPTERNLAEFDILVRDSRALPILERVMKKKEDSFSSLVASVRPFGDQLRSNFKRFDKVKKSTSQYKLYMNEGLNRRQYWVESSFVKNNLELVSAWKVLVPKAGSDGGQTLPDAVLGKPIIAEPGSVCTETYLAIGPFATNDEAASALSYLTTRFARFLISVRKPGQDNVPSTFLWVPGQDWDRSWTDDELYSKYAITEEEQAYIETMIKEMPE